MAKNEKETREKRPKVVKERRSFFFSPLWFAIIVLLLVGVGYVVAQKPWIVSNNAATNMHSVVQQVLPASEYTCLVYNYSTVHQATKNITLNNWPVPFTESKLLYTIDGTIKLGIYGSLIGVEFLLSSITITLPPVQLLSHEVFPDRVMVYDERNGLFNHFTLEEHFEIEASQKVEIENRVKQDGVLFAQAREAVEQQLGGFLRNLPGVKGIYTVNFVWAEEEPQE
jgi:hypothetical protein